jgi:P-type Ca2+ transporter type 2C
MYATLSTEEVLTKMGGALGGLCNKEIVERLSRYGFNELPLKKKPLGILFVRQFHDILIYILFGALALSIIAPFLEGGDLTIESFLDSIVIFAILLLNAVLGFVQEYRAEKAIEHLKKLTAPHSRVRRDGKEQIIPSRDLVPGDIIILETGDRISADGRLLEESHLRTDESSLTGESHAISKNTKPLEKEGNIADRKNCVFAGTLVTRGSAEYIVTATGLDTEIGKIAKLVAETEFPITPLQKRMMQLGKLIGAVVLALCLFVITVGLLQGMPFLEILLVGVSLAVSAVPEGLPAVVTVCLAMGVRRMVSKNALVRRLSALETLGSVSVICADKTGTITQNKMKVVQVSLASEADKSLLLQIIGSCNHAQLPDLGDPTEIGLLAYAEKEGAKREEIDAEEVPFSSEDKYMQTHHEGRSYLKGAPEKIVELCDEVDAGTVLKQNEAMATKGLRVLACAVQEKGVTRFVGLVGMEDPPRRTVKAAIAEAKKAGIRTIMITGDNIVTAKAIAKKVGIEGEAMMGEELNDMTAKELSRRLEKVSVFARVSPEHKLLILEALEHTGHIVAMSGDGVNDAPALKGAHVGVAMGKNGTEVARTAASIVLADDHYATIVSAISEGRRIYDNIRKFVLFLLRANFDELLLIATTIILGIPLPYLPIHILWINLMTDGLPALALGMEKAEPDIMRRPPRPPNEHLLSGEWGRLVIAALWAFAVAFLFYLWQLSKGVPLEEARTTTLTLAINFELLMAFTVRSHLPIWKIGFFSNKWMLGAVAIPFLLQIILLYSPLSLVFHLTPITLIEWGEIFLLAFSGFAVFEMMKLVHVRKRG